MFKKQIWLFLARMTDCSDLPIFVGAKRYVVVSGNLDKPHDIEIDSAAGMLFWSDVGQVPKIERAGLDGSDRGAIQ